MNAPILSFSGGHKWLSNFAPCRIFFEGEWYESVEHAYQASKSFDLAYRERVRKASVVEAKRMGKTSVLKAAGLLRHDWCDEVMLSIMEALLRQKFSQVFFFKKLKETVGRELIEGNWWGDTFWGFCRGKGFNHLGKIIMKIRDELCL